MVGRAPVQPTAPGRIGRNLGAAEGPSSSAVPERAAAPVVITLGSAAARRI